MARAILLALALTVAVVRLAAADALDDQTRHIAKQLRCPICESVSVADSNAELAGQMRALIRRKLEAGESEQQIVDYFVAAYGDAVLLDPPRRGLGWAAWLGPIVALAAGLVIVLVLLRSWVRAGRVMAAPPLPRGAVAGRVADGHVAEARRELDAVRKGLGG